jgi:FkbM family methyltransferase
MARAARIDAPLQAVFGSKGARRSQLDDRNLRLLLSFCLRADSNCIDVGSYKGWVLAEMLRTAPLGHHIAYEPLPHLAQALATRFPKAEVRCAALSNVEGTSSFRHVKNHPAWSGFRETAYERKVVTEEIVVKTERLDDHLPAGYIPPSSKSTSRGPKS